MNLLQNFPPCSYRIFIPWASRVLLQTFTAKHTNRKLSIVMALSITFTQFAPETTKFGKITQNEGHFAVQGHSRSPILVPIEISYTTSYQWLILTYLLSCTVCEVKPSKCHKSLYLATPFAFKPPDGGVPYEDLRKIVSECQWMAKVPNGEETAENFNRLSRVHERYRQTDDRPSGDSI